jgi:hypothetical protein
MPPGFSIRNWDLDPSYKIFITAEHPHSPSKIVITITVLAAENQIIFFKCCL